MKKRLEAFLLNFTKSTDIRQMNVQFEDGSFNYAFVFKDEYIDRDRERMECWIKNGIDWTRLQDTLDLFFEIEKVREVIDKLPEIYELYRSSCQCVILLENINWHYGLGWMIDDRIASYCPGCGSHLPLALETDISDKENRFERIGCQI